MQSLARPRRTALEKICGPETSLGVCLAEILAEYDVVGQIERCEWKAVKSAGAPVLLGVVASSTEGPTNVLQVLQRNAAAVEHESSSACVEDIDDGRPVESGRQTQIHAART